MSYRSANSNQSAPLTLLDGAMGTELIERGASTHDGLWSAGALLDAPEAVLDIHVDYIKSGAQIITTNTYSTIPSYLEKAGLASRYEELARKAGSIAKQAVDKTSSHIKIAASIPPLDESYRPDLVQSPEESFPVYVKLATALIPFVDYFLCETMSSIQEAEITLRGVKTALGKKKVPIWVSFTLTEEPEGCLRSGESVELAVSRAEEQGAQAVLFNCTSPESIEYAVGAVADKTKVPVGGYPNRFSEVPTNWTLDNDLVIKRNEQLNESTFVDGALRCKAKGATIYGGCCGIRPSFIRALGENLRTENV